MTPDEITALVRSKLEERGYRGRVVPIEHVTELKHDIEEWLHSREIDVAFFESRLSRFKFDVDKALPSARSIIVTAAPEPQRRTTFHFDGQTYSVVIPPTYYGDTDDQIMQILEDVLSSHGYRLYPTVLPEKLLAVRSGMAKYGKNNIVYVEGLGSFVSPRAFVSDMPPGSSDWLGAQVMKECEKCKACLSACPTKAIVPDRFLIHAERCLTFLNEERGEFPEWVDPAWHNSLVGCMKCQLVCPVNKRVVKWVEEGEDFTESETRLILDAVPLERIPPGTVDKLKRCYMLEYLDLLPRNLRVLMK